MESIRETGSDVSVIRRNLLPQIDEDYDVVVLMVGLNDFKQLGKGEFLADALGLWKDLEALVDEVEGEDEQREGRAAGVSCRRCWYCGATQELACGCRGVGLGRAEKDYRGFR